MEQSLGTYFLYGGGIEEIEFVGDPIHSTQTGFETLGWLYGTLKNCLFRNFKGHGLRVIGNALDPNPDWTASMLRLRNLHVRTYRRMGFHRRQSNRRARMDIRSLHVQYVRRRRSVRPLERPSIPRMLLRRLRLLERESTLARPIRGLVCTLATPRRKR